MLQAEHRQDTARLDRHSACSAHDQLPGRTAQHHRGSEPDAVDRRIRAGGQRLQLVSHHLRREGLDSRGGHAAVLYRLAASTAEAAKASRSVR